MSEHNDTSADIVERLRKASDRSGREWFYFPLVVEAADTIINLRQQITDLQRHITAPAQPTLQPLAWAYFLEGHENEPHISAKKRGHEALRQKPWTEVPLYPLAAQPPAAPVKTIQSIEAEARRYADMYPQSSDCRNTFTIFADWISDQLGRLNQVLGAPVHALPGEQGYEAPTVSPSSAGSEPAAWQWRYVGETEWKTPSGGRKITDEELKRERPIEQRALYTGEPQATTQHLANSERKTAVEALASLLSLDDVLEAIRPFAAIGLDVLQHRPGWANWSFRSKWADHYEITYPQLEKIAAVAIALEQGKTVEKATLAHVTIKPMTLSGGRTVYFVSIRVGDREVTPHVFRDEEFKAAYHVALYDWLLNGAGEEPEVVEFGPDDWPARARTIPPVSDERAFHLARCLKDHLTTEDAAIAIMEYATDAIEQFRREDCANPSELLAVLEPLAKAADAFDDNVYGDRMKLGTEVLTLGMLRKARALHRSLKGAPAA